MHSSLRAIAIGTALLLAGNAVSSVAASDAARINSANQLLRDNKVQEALEAFAAADKEVGQHQDQLQYNWGVALYRSKDWESAAARFRKSAGSRDRQIAGRSHYNLGNCRYAEALGRVGDRPETLQSPEREAAVDDLREAIRHYRDALRSLPELTDARANIELAAKLIEQLEQRNEQPQEGQSQEDQSQEDQSQEDQSQEDQSKEDQSKEDQSKEDQSKEDQSKEDQSKEDQSKEDQSKEDQSKEDQSKEDQSKEDQSKEDQSKEDQSKENSSQGNSSSKPEDGQKSDEDGADPGQRNDDAQSKEANHRDSEENSEQEDDAHRQQAQRDEDEAADPIPKGELSGVNPSEDMARQQGTAAKSGVYMTREEALKLLQAVRDRDMARRWRLQQRIKAQRPRVERDW